MWKQDAVFVDIARFYIARNVVHVLYSDLLHMLLKREPFPPVTLQSDAIQNVQLAMFSTSIGIQKIQSGLRISLAVC